MNVTQRMPEPKPESVPQKEAFRDSIGMIDKSGNRVWIYPRKPSGTYHSWRVVTALVLLVILFGLPFVEVDGHPFVLFNVVERKFILFGLAFWPQDFHLFALTFLVLIVFVVLFTAVFGRVWCGWACPQTIFMEMVFRKIEYWIEGDGPQQFKLDRAPMSASKLFKKTGKHAVFIALSWLIGNTFLAYIIGIDQLFQIIREPIGEHLVGFSFMAAFSLTFYGVFARFREQACVYVCPYGRLQSVLLDKNSVVVAYDFVRGEPRGKIRKGTDRSGNGDCIDCGMCVQVCPTGIDIRNGTQMECVNCTACIDACDHVMKTVGKPPRLIRYSSVNQIAEKLKFQITPRIIGYTGLFSALLILSVLLLANRTNIETTVLRAKGATYQLMPDGNVRNVYTAKFVNKTFEEIPIRLEVLDVPATVTVIGQDRLLLKPDELMEATLIIDIPQSSLTVPHRKINIGIYRGDREISREETSFVGPGRKKGS